MKWTTERPKFWEYYWAIPLDHESLLDGSPEIVKVYFDGKLKVFRPGEDKAARIEDFEWWSDEPIPRPRRRSELWMNQ